MQIILIFNFLFRDINFKYVFPAIYGNWAEGETRYVNLVHLYLLFTGIGQL